MKSLPNVKTHFFSNPFIVHLDGRVSAIRLIALDRKEAEEFYEVYRNVVPEYSQMVSDILILFNPIAISS